MVAFQRCRVANRIERDDCCGEVHSDVMGLFFCDLVATVGRGQIFPNLYIVIGRYQIYVTQYESYSLDDFRNPTFPPLYSLSLRHSWSKREVGSSVPSDSIFCLVFIPHLHLQ